MDEKTAKFDCRDNWTVLNTQCCVKLLRKLVPPVSFIAAPGGRGLHEWADVTTTSSMPGTKDHGDPADQLLPFYARAASQMGQHLSAIFNNGSMAALCPYSTKGERRACSAASVICLSLNVALEKSVQASQATTGGAEQMEMISVHTMNHSSFSVSLTLGDKHGCMLHY